MIGCKGVLPAEMESMRSQESLRDILTCKEVPDIQMRAMEGKEKSTIHTP